MTIPDNADLFEMHDREMEAKAQKLPRCERCGEPIYQYKAVRINRCWYCDNCIEELREDTTDDSDF